MDLYYMEVIIASKERPMSPKESARFIEGLARRRQMSRKYR
jgi:hypothetical protein